MASGTVNAAKPPWYSPSFRFASSPLEQTLRPKKTKASRSGWPSFATNGSF